MAFEQVWVKKHFFPKRKAMKKQLIASIFALLFAGGSALMAQAQTDEYLGLPGDNLNLYAVMNIFQESETIEGFERKLNDPEAMINNLDLNGDGYVDYLMVTAHQDGDLHTIVLSVALNEQEYQDVAVFFVQRYKDGSVQVQLVGDEALYGKDYIIEPIFAETPNPGYTGAKGTPVRTVAAPATYVEVRTWPVIRYIYSPTYVVYRPVWRWGYYPVYWQPWQAHYWHYYHGYHYRLHHHYRTYYRPWKHHRFAVYHTTYYTGYRRYSPVVVVNINKGKYKPTYNRPDQRRKGEERYEREYAHRTPRTPVGGTVSRPATPAGRTATRSASEVQGQRTARQPATRTGGTVRTRDESRSAARTTEVQQSRSESRSAARTTEVQRSNASERSNSRPAAVQQNRAPGRSSTPARVERNSSSNRESGRPAAVRESRTPSRSSQPARVERSSSPSRSSQPAKVERSNSSSRSRQPAKVERSSTPSRSRQPAKVERSSSSNRESGRPAAVRESRTPSRSSQPAKVERSSTPTRERRK